MRFVTVRDLWNKPAQVIQSLMQRIRAANAMGSMQKRSMALGNDNLSIDEINVEINAVRKARK